MTTRILIGDVRAKLAELPDESVHCVVTSPPYFGLRDYGTASWEGGDPACDHVEKNARNDVSAEDLARRAAQSSAGTGDGSKVKPMQFKGACNKCGAIRADKQIGLEDTPAAFVAVMVEVFREVRRVLRNDGVCWINLGDSYAASVGGVGNNPSTKSTLTTNNGRGPKPGDKYSAGQGGTPVRINHGLKPKDLIGIPWRVAFALQADGWYLRQDIIWSKPNPMPESVTDRCTKAHEYLFLLTKSARYHYDQAAIAEGLAPSSIDRLSQPGLAQQAGSDRVPGKTNGRMRAVPPRHAAYESSDQSGLDDVGRGGLRNKRSVWTVATQPFSEAHFATFPPALIEPCILAGCPKDCCAKCGAPVVRETEKTVEWPDRRGGKGENKDRADGGMACNAERRVTTTGWSPSCSCDAGTARGVCLDPFGGAGTTGLVADRHGRDAILIELNPEYAAIAERRIAADAGMFAKVAAE